MMAILGVLFAVVYMAVFYGGTAISVALTPLGLSAFGFELIYGVWFMAATIAAYIIRKPGAALITEVLASAIELLMGNSGGAFDNAKKYIESGAVEGHGKGTPAHKASVTGDTVGDTRKDVVGVALDIFIKSMSTVANTLAPIFRNITIIK